MNHRIDNFSITETPDKVVVDYVKSAKDWFDSVLHLVIGLFLSVMTYFLFRQAIKVTGYILVVAAILFAFQATIHTLSGLSRLFQPTKGILTINKKSNTLTSRHSPLITKTLGIDEIQAVVVSGQTKKLPVGGGKRLTRTFCTVSAKLRDDTERTLFTINTKRFFRAPNQVIETELYTSAKRLSAEINRHLKSKYQWTGYKAG